MSEEKRSDSYRIVNAALCIQVCYAGQKWEIRGRSCIRLTSYLATLLFLETAFQEGQTFSRININSREMIWLCS